MDDVHVCSAGDVSPSDEGEVPVSSVALSNTCCSVKANPPGIASISSNSKRVSGSRIPDVRAILLNHLTPLHTKQVPVNEFHHI